MKFDELDKKMRQFERRGDQCALPEVFIVARIDGRSFTRLTKEICKFEAPFDPVFRDHMVATVKHLMDCGLRPIYGYTQSDEISLLFGRDADSFDRKLRKLNSVLAGEASATFSVRLGLPACFDCRVIELPTDNLVVDYFRWRNEDAHRNALNGHCYWALRKSGKSKNEATNRLLGLSVADKNELLFGFGVNFNEVPDWEKRGLGLYYETYAKKSLNPKTGKKVEAERRRLKVDMNLPMKDQYSEFIRAIIK